MSHKGLKYAAYFILLQVIIQAVVALRRGGISSEEIGLVIIINLVSGLAGYIIGYIREKSLEGKGDARRD